MQTLIFILLFIILLLLFDDDYYKGDNFAADFCGARAAGLSSLYLGEKHENSFFLLLMSL